MTFVSPQRVLLPHPTDVPVHGTGHRDYVRHVEDGAPWLVRLPDHKPNNRLNRHALRARSHFRHARDLVDRYGQWPNPRDLHAVMVRCIQSLINWVNSTD